MAKLSSRRVGGSRSVFCTHCGEPTEVAQRAMSVFCPHCRQRLIIEDYTIKTYHASRLFATCGDIVVEKKGIVSAPIRVQNLMVRGAVKGDVSARGCVNIAGTGELKGDICAPKLIVADGAKLDGFLKISPEAPAPIKPYAKAGAGRATGQKAGRLAGTSTTRPAGKRVAKTTAGGKTKATAGVKKKVAKGKAQRAGATKAVEAATKDSGEAKHVTAAKPRTPTGKGRTARKTTKSSKP